MRRHTCTEAKQMLQLIRNDFGILKGELDYFASRGDKSVLKNIETQKELLERQTKELKKGLPVTLEYAEEILGKEFLGPDAVEKTWNVKLESKEIPPIPFTIEDLERAKELNQFLILRIPLTIQRMEELIKEPMFRTDWFKQEGFYTKDTSKPGWALVSKEPIPNSTSQNYIEQTQTICDYLDSEVFGDVEEMSEAYQNAIMEFEAKKQDLEKIIKSDSRECAKQLSELQVTKLTRQSPADVIHDLMVYKQNNDERLLENFHTWTSVCDSATYIVRVGGFESGGVGVGEGPPDLVRGNLGTGISRSQ